MFFSSCEIHSFGTFLLVLLKSRNFFFEFVQLKIFWQIEEFFSCWTVDQIIFENANLVLQQNIQMTVLHMYPDRIQELAELHSFVSNCFLIWVFHFFFSDSTRIHKTIEKIIQSSIGKFNPRKRFHCNRRTIWRWR